MSVSPLMKLDLRCSEENLKHVNELLSIAPRPGNINALNMAQHHFTQFNFGLNNTSHSLSVHCYVVHMCKTCHKMLVWPSL